MIRPSGPKPLKPMALPKKPSTKSSRVTARKPIPAAMTHLRNLVPTWMLKNLYAASVPATAAMVPTHGADDQAARLASFGSTNAVSSALLNAPTKTPWTAA